MGGDYQPGDRTNRNAWCDERNGCKQDPHVLALIQRMSDVVGAPGNHFEDIQVLDYGKGQRYETHHDHEGADTFEAFSGPRVLTFFLYLNDVRMGGETHFPFINATSLPAGFVNANITG